MAAGTAGDVPDGADVVVIGSGSAGLTAALRAASLGASVLLLERATTLGGTTAISGGVIWAPCHFAMHWLDAGDTPAAARAYILGEGGALDEALVDAFVANASLMARFVEEHTLINWIPLPWPDYHSEAEGASVRGRCSRARSPPAPSGTLPTSCSPRSRRGRGIRFPLRGCWHGCTACGSRGERSSVACWKGACGSVSRSGRAFARSVSRVPADRGGRRRRRLNRGRANRPGRSRRHPRERRFRVVGRAGGRTSRLAVRPPALAPGPRGGGARDGGRDRRRCRASRRGVVDAGLCRDRRRFRGCARRTPPSGRPWAPGHDRREQARRAVPPTSRRATATSGVRCGASTRRRASASTIPPG